MAFLSCVLLLGGANAFLATTSSFNVSTALVNFVDPLKVVFFDFDQVITVSNTGDAVLRLCDVNCGSYNSTIACTCNSTTTQLADFLVNNISSRVLAEGDIFFNGTDRRNRLAQTFELLWSKNVEIRIMSTSWFYLGAPAWANFIHKVFEIGNLTQYLNMSSILTLADPGEGISADKTGVMASYLTSKGWTLHNGLFVDDSPSNINAAAGKVDTLRVSPRTGLARDQLEWIDDRANPATCATPITNGATTACVGKKTGENCSVTCSGGMILTGPAFQVCTPTIAGASSFPSSQQCVAPNVTTTNVTTTNNTSTNNTTTNNGTTPTKVCPVAATELFYKSCNSVQLSTVCIGSCKTDSEALVKLFVDLKVTPEFVEKCIRNGTTPIPFTSSVSEKVVTRLKAGQTICGSVTNSAITPTAFGGLLLSTVLAMFA